MSRREAAMERFPKLRADPEVDNHFMALVARNITFEKWGLLQVGRDAAISSAVTLGTAFHWSKPIFRFRVAQE